MQLTRRIRNTNLFRYANLLWKIAINKTNAQRTINAENSIKTSTQS